MAPVTEQDDAIQEEKAEVAFADRPAGPESQGVMPVLLEGTKLQVVAGEYTGRMAYIVDINFATPEDEQRFHNPVGKKRNTAKVESYLVKTRDGRTDQFTVTPDQIRVLDQSNGWGRGSI